MKYHVLLDFVTFGHEAVGIVHGPLDLTFEPLPGDVICFSPAEGGQEPTPAAMPNAFVKGRVHYPAIDSQSRSIEVFFEPLVVPDRNSGVEFMEFLARKFDLYTELY